MLAYFFRGYELEEIVGTHGRWAELKTARLVRDEPGIWYNNLRKCGIVDAG